MNSNNYLDRFKNWIVEGKYLYIFLTLLILPLILRKFEINETGIKIYGLFLQILGALPLILSLIDKSLLFGKDPFLKSLIKYFSRFPGKLNRKAENSNASSSGITITAFDPRVKLTPNESFEDIIRYLEEEINYLEERISHDYDELNKKIYDLTKKIESHDRSIKKNLNELEVKIQTTNVSNVGRDYFGIFTLVYGIILATIPELIDKLLYLYY
jgi:hypothetical protein